MMTSVPFSGNTASAAKFHRITRYSERGVGRVAGGFLSTTNQDCIGSAPAPEKFGNEATHARRCIADTVCCSKPRLPDYGD